VAGRAREVSVDWRDGKVEKLSDTTTRGLSLELYVDGRYAAVTTKDLRPEALQRFIEDSVALTRTLEKDPFRSLPDPALQAGQAAIDLQLDDPALAGLSAVRRRELAQAAEAAARRVEGAGAIVSVTTGFGDTLSESWRVQSNGFETTRRATSFSVSGEVSVRDADGRRPEDWDAATTRHLASLPAAEAVGRRAAERALSRLGARKGKSATMTLVIDPRAAGTLVSHLLRPLSGLALQQRQSCFDGKLGVAIGSPLLDLADDPLLPRALGSRLFDGEGLAARRFPVFEKGALRSFYVDSYYGKKLKVAPTTRGSSNLAWGPGSGDRDALVAAAGEGLLVTGFIGGNSNSTTGDFSLGLNGNRISGGRVGEPISEMNVSGNHLELWKRLVAVGNDPYPYSPLRTPTLVLEGVAIAGV
jgi:PmbA protein